MLFVGLDIHQTRSSIRILDDRGQRVRQETVIGPWSRLIDKLRALEEPFVACVEASLGYGHLYEHLSAIARRVAVAHPGQLRLIFRSKKKNRPRRRREARQAAVSGRGAGGARPVAGGALVALPGRTPAASKCA